MSKLFIADTFAWLILAVVWSSNGWANTIIKIGFGMLLILHIWKGVH